MALLLPLRDAPLIFIIIALHNIATLFNAAFLYSIYCVAPLASLLEVSAYRATARPLNNSCDALPSSAPDAPLKKNNNNLVFLMKPMDEQHEK